MSRHRLSGPLAIKAVMWTVVEWMHSKGFGLLYQGPVESFGHVSRSSFCLRCISLNLQGSRCIGLRFSLISFLKVNTVWELCHGMRMETWRENLPVMLSTCPHLYLQVLYIVLAIVLLDYLHDTWFYFTHRLLHWRPLYRYVHCIHHRSVYSVHLFYLTGDSCYIIDHCGGSGTYYTPSEDISCALS
jgi:sterol desaturase/sphingolipid hydroxylase (fatty acid hydroxylase superfamily)